MFPVSDLLDALTFLNYNDDADDDDADASYVRPSVRPRVG